MNKILVAPVFLLAMFYTWAGVISAVGLVEHYFPGTYTPDNGMFWPCSIIFPICFGAIFVECLP